MNQGKLALHEIHDPWSVIATDRMGSDCVTRMLLVIRCSCRVNHESYDWRYRPVRWVAYKTKPCRRT